MHMQNVPDTRNNTKITGPVLAYTVFRFTMGVNLFTHGAVRLLVDYRGYVTHIMDSFRGTILPVWPVKVVAYTVPPAEAIIGLMLILGLFTRRALLLGALLTAAVVLGTCLQENWQLAGTHMIYALCFYVLLYNVEHDRISLDAKMGEN